MRADNGECDTMVAYIIYKKAMPINSTGRVNPKKKTWGRFFGNFDLTCNQVRFKF